MKLCIVIPVLNEEHYIKHHIQARHSVSDKADVFFVDGGSIDNTVTLLQMHSFNCLQMEGGRGACVADSPLYHSHQSKQ